MQKSYDVIIHDLSVAKFLKIFRFDFSFGKAYFSQNAKVPYLQRLKFGMTSNLFNLTAKRKQNNFEFGIKD